MTDEQLLDNLLKMEIDFGVYPEVQKEYEAFKKLSRKDQLKLLAKDPDNGSLLRAMALSMYSIEDNKV